MYEFSTTKPITLAVSVAVPDTKLARNNMTVIILSVRDDGSVSEVYRLQAKETQWKSFFEFFTGDRLRRGGEFRARIEPGLYRVEVSTPDNVGTYALFVGSERNTDQGGFGQRIGEILEIKKFWGKSAFSIVLSPFIYIPLLVSFSAGFCVVLLWRRRRAEGVHRAVSE